jgi:hypothetical protein
MNGKVVGELILLIVMGVMFLSDNLNDNLVYMLWFIGVVIFIWSLDDDRLITFQEARKLAKNEIIKMQRSRDIPSGEIFMMPETELKEIIAKRKGGATIDPYHWEVGVVVEGDRLYGYMVRLSKHGAILTVSQIKLPLLYSVTSSQRLIEISAEDTTDEKLPRRDRGRALRDEETEEEGDVQ